MAVYRGVLIWLLRIAALAQIVLGLISFVSMTVVMSGEVGGPVAQVQRDPIEQAVAIAIGPLVCLAVAEILAILVSQQKR